VTVAASAAPSAAGALSRQETRLSPDAGAYSHLDAVSAASATDVWVVGGYFNGTVSKTLIRHWDGAVWDEMPGPNQGGSHGSFLVGVSALSSTDAWAVGHYGSPAGIDETLIGRWDGVGWDAVSSPNPPDSLGSRLLGVTALSPTDVWAVGSYDDAAAVKTLVEHWDGTTWTLMPSPSPGKKGGSTLEGVTAVAQNDVWAVGHTGAGKKSKTLVEHWDGKAWSRQPSPNVGARGSALHGVSAASTADIWAVGDDFAAQRTLVEHWDGSAWSVVKSPSPGTAALSGVAALSADDAWAVGTYTSHATGAYVTLVERWDGSAWQKVPSPNPAESLEARLVGVSALSPSDAWSAGTYDTGARFRPLVEHWDGTDWTQS